MPSPGLPRQLAQIIRRAIQARLADCHFALPGKVRAYDASTNLADVEIMVKHPLFDDDGKALDGEDLGVLVGVPVKWDRAGGYYMTFPLQAGDEGELVFHSTPIGEWRSTGEKGDPDDASRFSLGWPTFRADLFNDSRPLPDVSARGAGIVIGKEGSPEQIRIQSGVIYIGANATDFAALSGKVGTELTKIAVNLNQCAAFINGISPGTVTPTPYTPTSTANGLVKVGP